MNSAKPPRLAAWLLQEFGPRVNQEALTGDLNEGFQQGRSKAWYWRQVLAAVRWRRGLFALLGSALMGWLQTSPIIGHTPSFLGRPIEMLVIMATYLASGLVPGMLTRRLRVLVTLLIVAILGLLWRFNPGLLNHYWMLFLIVVHNFAFYRKLAPPPQYLSWRELLMSDPTAARRRMIAKLERTMMEETDPDVRHAYAEAIAVLQTHEAPAAKATQ